MLNRCIFWSFVVFSLFFAQVAKAEPIGTIMEIEGSVTVTSPGQKAREAKIKDEISMNDVIATGPSSRAFILFIDDTEWTLSENAKFEVTEYVFNPDNAEDNKARYSILDGAFRYVSGLVAKKEKPDVNITTPVGSIGIRGTDFWGGPEEGEYGVYVDEGSVNVKTLGGETLLKRGEGSMVKSRNVAPGRAGAWRQDRIERMRKSVFLKNQGQIKQRRMEMQSRRAEMREKYRASMKERFQQLREKRGDRKEKIENLKERLQENRPQQRGELREKRQQQFQNWQENKGARQGQLQEKKEQWQDKKEEWQENHPQQGLPLRQRLQQRQNAK